MDGKPLARAAVGFAPTDGSRVSSGITDQDGYYVLRYIRDAMGAKVGPHAVTISTAHDRAGRTETVPARYNTATKLHADVVGGDNTINFDLTTKEPSTK